MVLLAAALLMPMAPLLDPPPLPLLPLLPLRCAFRPCGCGCEK